MKLKYSEARDYKQVLKMIRDEIAAGSRVSYETEQLKARMQEAQILKFGIMIENVLMKHNANTAPTIEAPTDE